MKLQKIGGAIYEHTHLTEIEGNSLKMHFHYWAVQRGEGLPPHGPEHGHEPEVLGLGEEHCCNNSMLILIILGIVQLLHSHLLLPMHPLHGGAEHAHEGQDHEVHGQVGPGEGAKNPFYAEYHSRIKIYDTFGHEAHMDVIAALVLAAVVQVHVVPAHDGPGDGHEGTGVGEVALGDKTTSNFD